MIYNAIEMAGCVTINYAFALDFPDHSRHTDSMIIFPSPGRDTAITVPVMDVVDATIR